jgi:hypothetical protein
MLEKFVDPDASILIRTDFSDNVAWEGLLNALAEPNAEGFCGYFAPVDDRQFEGIDIAKLASLARQQLQNNTIYVADSETLVSGENPILCLDLHGEDDRYFRVVPAEAWGPENNLRISNMDYSDFLNAADDDGVFRGFKS